MFRVYDKKLEKWVSDDEFCISSYGDLFIVKHTMFGKDKIDLVSDDRYIVHNYINANDVYGNPIFEGDICMHTEDESTYGVVAYSDEHAAYYVFDENNSAYYMLIGENREEMRVVGNVFDGIIANIENVSEDVEAKEDNAIDE